MSDFSPSRRQVLAAVGSIGVGSAAVGAGTFAAFSDTEQSSGNDLTTGTLNLETGSPKTLSFQTGDIAPGDSGKSAVSLVNAGSVAGTLGINIAAVTDSEGNTPESETSGIALSEILELKMWTETNGGGSGTEGQYDSSYDTGIKSDGTVTSSGSSLSFADADQFPTGTGTTNRYDLGSLDGTDDFYVSWRLPSDGGDKDINGVMDDTTTIDFEFHLTQA